MTHSGQLTAVDMCRVPEPVKVFCYSFSTVVPDVKVQFSQIKCVVGSIVLLANNCSIMKSH